MLTVNEAVLPAHIVTLLTVAVGNSFTVIVIEVENAPVQTPL